MIKLFKQNIQRNDRQSSKGNQGIWYKAGYTGYEALAEYIISHMLERSTLLQEEYVQKSLQSNLFN